MARQARQSGEYLHVIIRGIGKQILFEDEKDHLYFLSLLQRFKAECGIIILAYCMMENHVHILIRDVDGKTPLFMKKTGVSYAGYYNKRYDRVGHLFQDRYKSETITDDGNLMAVFRYILNNPRKAGICSPFDYAWSSIHEYGKSNGISDSSLIKSMLGPEENLAEFLKTDDKTGFMEDEPAKRDDAWAMETMRRILKASSGTVLQNMSKEDRNEMLAKLKHAGLSVRQIERLTGINRGIIQKAKSVE